MFLFYQSVFFLCSVLFFAQSITVVISIIFGVVVCQQYHVCPRNIPRTFRKMSTFNHETRGEHSARRRGPIHCVCIFTLLNMHIRFLVHVCPHYQIRIFIPPHTYVRSSFCRFFYICGRDKSDPYGCWRSVIMLLIGCYFAVVYVSANTIKLCLHVHLQLTMAQQHTQNAYFCNVKTPFLHAKNHTFARQKGGFCRMV